MYQSIKTGQTAILTFPNTYTCYSILIFGYQPTAFGIMTLSTYGSDIYTVAVGLKQITQSQSGDMLSRHKFYTKGQNIVAISNCVINSQLCTEITGAYVASIDIVTNFDPTGYNEITVGQ